MNRIHDMPPGVIENLNDEFPVGLDAGGWGYITMGPDRDPDSVPNDGWGLLVPQYYYYMPPAFTTHATTHPPQSHCRWYYRCCWNLYHGRQLND